ncbi:MAG TPA: hypothetical protein VN642_13685, partial [Dongiaceae bacterium]|nr:hypothetical protein [Dongiaceae bacterium]
MQLRSRLSCLRLGFQFKLLCVFTLLTAFTTIFFCTLYITSEITEKRDYTREKVLLQAQQLADSVRLPLYAENRTVLQQLAEQAGMAPEIRAVEISASDGRVLVNTRMPNTSGSNEMISQLVEVHSNKLVDSIESSISGGRDVAVSRIGTVRIERGTADLARAIREFVIFTISGAFVFWLAVSLLCYLALRK